MNNVIERIDSIEDDNYGSTDPLKLQSRGSDPNAENYNNSQSGRPPKAAVREAPATRKSAKRKRKQLTRRRMAELPDFDVEEILGEFEVDADGNYIVLQTANGKLNDKYGRQVNRRGYLVDP